MTWIKVHQALTRHRKTVVLAAGLKLPRVYAIGHLVNLWLWAIDNAPDGMIGNLPPEVVAFGAEWDGEPEQFLAALTAAGFVDSTGQIHDWQDHAGRLLDRRAANAERMRSARALHVQRTSETRAASTKNARAKTSETRAAHVQRKSRVEKSREESVPNGTLTGDAPASPQERDRNPYWDALVAGSGVEPKTEAERKRYGKVSSQLKRDGATPEQVAIAFKNYPAHFGDCAMTPEAILKHFSLLQTQPKDRSNGHAISRRGTQGKRAEVGADGTFGEGGYDSWSGKPAPDDIPF